MTIKHVSFNEREEKRKRHRKPKPHRQEKNIRNILNSKSFDDESLKYYQELIQ